MSKFIETQCGSLVNLDSISSIKQNKINIKDTLVFIKYIIVDNHYQEFIYNSSYFDYSIEDTQDYICEDSFCNFTILEITDFIKNNISNVLKSQVKYNLIKKTNWSFKLKDINK